MKLLAGTSGFAFKEWKGSFYPADMKDDGMLSYYARQFPTVEINNTFYRLPRQNVLLDWVSQVPEEFTLAIKASQRITHFGRLKPESAPALNFLLDNTSVMGARLGPILFQLPPNMKKDAERLQGFLELLPADRRFTMEFRHESWFDAEVYELLRAHNVAMCVIDQAEFSSPMESTASWGYVRLHRFDYDAPRLNEWVSKIRGQEWEQVYVYFKHDESTGSGPPAVLAFGEAWGI